MSIYEQFIFTTNHIYKQTQNKTQYTYIDISSSISPIE